MRQTEIQLCMRRDSGCCGTTISGFGRVASVMAELCALNREAPEGEPPAPQLGC